MKRKHIIFKFLSLIMSVSLLFAVGCGGEGEHTHVFDQKVQTEEYFKSEATCTEPMKYYYSCSCGAIGEETFSVGTKGMHVYSAERAEEEYVRNEATCLAPAVYYKSCLYCGRNSKAAHLTFNGTELGDHVYDQEIVRTEYLATEATYESAATYHKSCICGLASDDTFEDGVPLWDLTSEEKEKYTPTVVTMTLYEPENAVYGITYHTQERPLRPVLEIAKGSTLSGAQEIGVTYSKYNSLAVDSLDQDYGISYYVSKAQLDLEPSTTYTYRICDRYADVETDKVTFTTKDASATSFKFSHVSDSQGGPSNFSNVLQHVDSDFLLHTGDIVEYGKYEHEWQDMIGGNFDYLSKLPMMVTGGNHDIGAYYRAGTDTMVKHFNHKIPEQSTLNGYYYSFTYGNAKFIMLNTNEGSNKISTGQYNWLVNELENNDSDWTIVAMHAPLYAIGQWGGNPEKNQQSLALRAQLGDVFAQYGVDLVLQGHDHLISRTYPIAAEDTPTKETWQEENGVQYSIDPNGVIYVMDGKVGPATKGIEENTGNLVLYYHYAQTAPSSVWSDIEINGDTLTFTLKNSSDGSVNVIQQWGIKKNLAA